MSHWNFTSRPALCFFLVALCFRSSIQKSLGGGDKAPISLLASEQDLERVRRDYIFQGDLKAWRKDPQGIASTLLSPNLPFGGVSSEKRDDVKPNCRARRGLSTAWIARRCGKLKRSLCKRFSAWPVPGQTDPSWTMVVVEYTGGLGKIVNDLGLQLSVSPDFKALMYKKTRAIDMKLCQPTRRHVKLRTLLRWQCQFKIEDETQYRFREAMLTIKTTTQNEACEKTITLL